MISENANTASIEDESQEGGPVTGKKLNVGGTSNHRRGVSETEYLLN